MQHYKWHSQQTSTRFKYAYICSIVRSRSFCQFCRFSSRKEGKLSSHNENRRRVVHPQNENDQGRWRSRKERSILQYERHTSQKKMFGQFPEQASEKGSLKGGSKVDFPVRNDLENQEKHTTGEEEGEQVFQDPLNCRPYRHGILPSSPCRKPTTELRIMLTRRRVPTRKEPSEWSMPIPRSIPLFLSTRNTILRAILTGRRRPTWRTRAGLQTPGFPQSDGFALTSVRLSAPSLDPMPSSQLWNRHGCGQALPGRCRDRCQATANRSMTKGIRLTRILNAIPEDKKKPSSSIEFLQCPPKKTQASCGIHP